MDMTNSLLTLKPIFLNSKHDCGDEKLVLLIYYFIGSQQKRNRKYFFLVNFFDDNMSD